MLQAYSSALQCTLSQYTRTPPAKVTWVCIDLARPLSGSWEVNSRLIDNHLDFPWPKKISEEDAAFPIRAVSVSVLALSKACGREKATLAGFLPSLTREADTRVEHRNCLTGPFANLRLRFSASDASLFLQNHDSIIIIAARIVRPINDLLYRIILFWNSSHQPFHYRSLTAVKIGVMNELTRLHSLGTRIESTSLFRDDASFTCSLTYLQIPTGSSPGARLIMKDLRSSSTKTLMLRTTRGGHMSNLRTIHVLLAMARRSKRLWKVSMHSSNLVRQSRQRIMVLNPRSRMRPTFPKSIKGPAATTQDITTFPHPCTLSAANFLSLQRLPHHLAPVCKL